MKKLQKNIVLHFVLVGGPMEDYWQKKVQVIHCHSCSISMLNICTKSTLVCIIFIHLRFRNQHQLINLLQAHPYVISAYNLKLFYDFNLFLRLNILFFLCSPLIMASTGLCEDILYCWTFWGMLLFWKYKDSLKATHSLSYVKTICHCIKWCIIVYNMRKI